MDVEVIPYLIPYFVSALISLGVAFYAWLRRGVPGSKPFVVLALSQVVWTMGYAFELAAPMLEGKIFWDDVQFVAAFFWPIAYLMFILQFSGRQFRRPRLMWAILGIPAVLFLLLLLTDSRHHLVRPEAVLIPGNPFDALYYEFSTLVLITAVYEYGLLAGGMFVLVKSFVHAHRLYRKQAALVFIGTLFPIVGTLISLTDFTLYGQRDSTPLTFAISNVIVAWALYRYGLFDIVPIARDKVVENMSDLVFVVDGQNRFVDINPAAEQVLGRSNGDVIGQLPRNILTQWVHLLPLFEGEAETVVEIEVTYQGIGYFLAVKMTPLYDDQGLMNGRLIVARDITDMKLAEQKLQEHAAQLETANEELLALSEIKDEFVTNVSHELRTPLANLKLYHDLLRRKPARMSAYTDILQRETERLELIIEDLLALSRLDRGDDVIHAEETDLNDLVQTLVLDRHRLAARAGVDLQVKLADNLALVRVDASMITQVLSILLTNAVNYTTSGGEILVFTQVKVEQEKPWNGFCVQDKGYGITAVEQAQLFTRFFRGGASKQTGSAGTGLGLAIAKEIIDQHHGQIEIHSTGVPGEGTAVYVWLPVLPDSSDDINHHPK